MADLFTAEVLQLVSVLDAEVGDIILVDREDPQVRALIRTGRIREVDVDNPPTDQTVLPPNVVEIANGLAQAQADIDALETDDAADDVVLDALNALPFFGPSAKGPAYRPASTAFNFQSGHGWTAIGSGVASSNLNDTTAGSFIKGSQSVRVTSAGNAGQAAVRRTGMSAMDLTDKAFRVTFKVDDTTNLAQISLLVGTGSFTNYFGFNLHLQPNGPTSWVRSGEWVTITAGWEAVNTVSGSYTLGSNKAPSTKTGFTDIQLAVYDKTGTSGLTYHLQSIEIISATSDTFPKGVVSLTFDDGWASVWNYARPKMDSLGYRGTAYIISDYIGADSSRLSMAQLHALQDNSGWEIAGHAAQGVVHGATNGMSGLTAAQVELDHRNMKAWLQRNGFRGDSFAYPQGHFEQTTDGVLVSEITSRHWSSGRTIISTQLETWPPAAPMKLRSLTGVSEFSGVNTPANLVATGGQLDRVANQGGWLILCLHQFLSGSGSPTDTATMSQVGFEAICDGIAARGIPVLPVSDVMRQYS